MQFHKWLGSSKGKVRSTLQENISAVKRILLVKAFGPEDFHVSTVGRNEAAIRRYIKEQEREDQRIDQLSLY